MKDKKNIKKHVKWIIIAIIFVVLYIVFALFINNQNDRKSNNYLLIGNKLIWNEIDGKFYQLTDVSDNLLKNKFTVDNGNKYQADNLQFTDRKWYFFDKDYNEIIYDDSSIAYSGDLDVSTISYDILNYDKNDDQYIQEVAQPQNDSLFNIYTQGLNKVIYDFDGDGEMESLYFMTNASLTVTDYSMNSYMFIVKNNEVTDIVKSDDDTFNLEGVLDINNDGKLELVISYGAINISTFDACYQIYHVNGGKFDLIQNCLYS